MISLALALTGALAGPPANAEFEAGKTAFAEERYADAADRFERAYQQDQEPLVLFAWAQAERLAGDCEEAVRRYREFLALDPPDSDVEMTRKAIEACGEDPDAPLPVAEPEEPEPEPDEVVPEPEPEPEPPPPAPRSRPAARDPWGHALTWSGVVVSAVGAGLLGEAHRRRGEGDQAPDEQGYREALEGAPGLSRAGIGMLVGGGALLVAGVVRFSVVAVRGRRQAEAARLRPSGPGLTWKFELAPRRSWALR